MQLHELIAERDRSVLVFERVPGIDLGRHTAAQPGGRLEEAGAHDVVLQLAGALRYFHGMGVAHMDLKPENCMREPEGRLRLVDYGSAQAFDAADGLACAWVEDNGGTEAYLAPERLDGGSLLDYTATDELGRVLGPPADVYALGVILYELLSGEPPFDFDYGEDGELVGVRVRVRVWVRVRV